MSRALLVIVTCSLAHADSHPRPAPEPLIAALLARLGPAASCPGSHRVWCIASERWSAATAADLPPTGVVAGITIGLERDKPDAELLETAVSLSALAVKDGRGLIIDIPPENATEKKTIGAAIAQIGAVLKNGGHVELPPALARLLATLPAGATHPLTRTPAGWRMSGKAEGWIRRIPGGPWIAVEVPGDGPIGIFVSIYPSDWH